MKKKRVAFVTNPLDSGFRSSISIVTLELAKRLTADYDVTVYAGKGKEERAAPPGIKIRRLPSHIDQDLRRLTGKLAPLYSLRKPFFSSPLYYPLYMTRLALDIRKCGFDIVHLHNFTQFIPVIRALNPGLKIVLHMHSEWLTQLDRKTMRQRIKNADLVLNCSEFITSRTRAAFPEAATKCKTLYNGVDVGNFSTPLSTETAERKKQTLLCVGRITPEKGLHVVIEAFNSLGAKYPDLELCLVGQERITPKEFLIELSDDERVRSLKAFYPGSYKKKIMESLVPALSARVNFFGHVSHPEMVSKYSEATIFINASYYESFGIPVAEAMACGLPVVASRAGGVPEIVENGLSGLLVEPGNAGDLASAVSELLENRNERESLARAGRERISEHFNWDTIAGELSNSYSGMYRS
ncbi:phosphatidyl-myo-inositol dimannoside synthase [uncultured bacterium]|nr:phosphatidyl-myo-inositol dimannoside synthase [uncultured bacterium]